MTLPTEIRQEIMNLSLDMELQALLEYRTPYPPIGVYGPSSHRSRSWEGWKNCPKEFDKKNKLWFDTRKILWTMNETLKVLARLSLIDKTACAETMYLLDRVKARNQGIDESIHELASMAAAESDSRVEPGWLQDHPSFVTDLDHSSPPLIQYCDCTQSRCKLAPSNALQSELTKFREHASRLETAWKSHVDGCSDTKTVQSSEH